METAARPFLLPRPLLRAILAAATILCFCCCLLAVAGRSARAGSWALLIGIDQYPETSGLNRLKGADNDAAALSQVLQQSLHIPAGPIHLLTSSGAVKPTKDNINDELEWLASKSKTIAPKKDGVFVAYSGHSMTDDQTHEPYLITYNALGKTKRLRFKMSLPQREFDDALLSLPAHTANEPQVVAKFFACSPGEFSYEIPGQSRGYFSFYQEQGLRGYAADAKTGRVSLSGLQAYLAKAVPDAMEKDRRGTAPQVPTSTIIGPLDSGGFVIVTVNAATLTGIKTASAKMQHAIALVPELLQQATITAKVAGIQAQLEVWRAQIKSGDTDAAKQTFSEVKQTAADMMDTSDKSWALSAIGQAQARADDIAEAKQTAAIKSDVYKSEVFFAIAQTQAETGAFFEAREMSEKITGSDGKAIAIARLASAILDAAKRESDGAGQRQDTLPSTGAKETQTATPNVKKE